VNDKPEARDPYVERRLRVLEQQVAAIARALGLDDATEEQPVGALEQGHRDFVERIKGGR
jgi:hypothetical protein